MIVFRTGFGVGDILMATGVLRAFRRLQPQPMIVETHYPELFQGNPDAWQVWKDGKVTDGIQAAFGHRFIWRIGNFLTSKYDQLRITPHYPFPSKGVHVMDSMANTIGVTLLPEDHHPFLYLSNTEKKSKEWVKDWVAVQSSSSTYWTPNKNWVPGRMQQVVNILKKEGYSLVHLGSAEDTPLDNVTDLRGKTTLREGAAILANTSLFIGLEGGLVHLARSVGRTCVVIYTGYTTPEETGYPENINLRSPSTGASCWNQLPCEHCRESAQQISADFVLQRSMKLLRG